MTADRYLLLASAGQNIADIPVPTRRLEPEVTFEQLLAETQLPWPLPEFSHDQFMRERDHAAWIAGIPGRLATAITKPKRKPAVKKKPAAKKKAGGKP